MDPKEPETVLVQTFHVRREDVVARVADTIVDLLNAERAVIDLSRHDRRADVIELRLAEKPARSSA